MSRRCSIGKQLARSLKLLRRECPGTTTNSTTETSRSQPRTSPLSNEVRYGH
jgi:hypothetical protein